MKTLMLPKLIGSATIFSKLKNLRSTEVDTFRNLLTSWVLPKHNSTPSSAVDSSSSDEDSADHGTRLSPDSPTSTGQFSAVLSFVAHSLPSPEALYAGEAIFTTHSDTAVSVYKIPLNSALTVETKGSRF